MVPARVLCVFGTRPEAIKVAPIIRAAQHQRTIDVISCSTGQHKEMLDQVTEYFEIKPQVDLALMRSGQSLTGLTSRCLTGLEQTIAEHKPDFIVGQGDTTTAMCAGLAAFYHRIPYVHVEAGLRTDDIRSPFPEELNRRICSLVTAFHCAPTETAAKNLYDEGFSPDDVVVTGNTVIDALHWTLEKERVDGHRWIEKHPDIAGGRSVLITAHRRENHGAGIRQLCGGIRILADRFPNVQFVFPVHLNPQISAPVRESLGNVSNISLIAPASYPEFVWLMDQATLILSDSGGVQEEAPSLKKPVLVTRNSTERPEALTAGATRLIGTSTERVVNEVSRLLTDKEAYIEMQIDENPYGDGKAAKRILNEILVRHHGTNQPLEHANRGALPQP